MLELETNLQEVDNLKCCVHCGANVKSDAQFCSSCGKPLNIAPSKIFCTKCGSELEEMEMFCHKCGSPTAQNRDAEVLRNITAYNDAIGKPKVINLINIKNYSIFSFISCILVALFVSAMSFELTTKIAYSIDFNDIFTPSIISGAIGNLAYFITIISGILFWKNEKKLRIMPVIASAVGTVACVCYFDSCVIHIETLVSALLIHIIAILFAIKVIKTKTVLLITSISAISLSLIIPFVTGHENIFPFIFSIPVFLLTFTFTTKELKETKRWKKLLRAIIAFVVTFVLILSGVGLGLYQSWVYVGDIYNMNVDVARDKYNRLDIETIYQYSDNVEKDSVVSQSIEKGSFVHPNNVIVLTISKGPGVKISTVYNRKLSDVKKELEDLGLKVETKYEYNSDIKKDHILSISSYHVDEGSTVTLKVSKGRDPRVTVPDVSYMSLSEAKKILKNLGFKVKVKYVYGYCDAYKNRNEIVSQSLFGKQKKGSTVTINVAKPSISISNVKFDHNYVGGVDVDISFKNISDKKIKYVTFTARFANSVGDDVYCSIRSTSTRNLEYTGPLSSGNSETVYWDAVIYNWKCSQIHFDEIEVTFMDGTTQEMAYYGYWYH